MGALEERAPEQCRSRIANHGLECAAMKHQLRALLDQLPPSPLARTGVVLALAMGAVVAISVPVFFALMLAAMLRGG